MKRKYFLTSKEHKDGFYHFYLNGKDVTELWHEFFSELSMEQEKDCEKIFIKRYAKDLMECPCGCHMQPLAKWLGLSKYCSKCIKKHL
jgi:hypothetical protein